MGPWPRGPHNEPVGGVGPFTSRPGRRTRTRTGASPPSRGAGECRRPGRLSYTRGRGRGWRACVRAAGRYVSRTVDPPGAAIVISLRRVAKRERQSLPPQYAFYACTLVQGAGAGWGAPSTCSVSFMIQNVAVPSSGRALFPRPAAAVHGVMDIGLLVYRSTCMCSCRAASDAPTEIFLRSVRMAA